MTPQTIRVDECNKIIDKLSDKTLSFGCILDIQDQNGYERRMIIDDVINTTKSIESWHEEDGTFHAIKINTIQKIIGHPVLIGDVLEKMRQIDCHDTYILRLWGECGKLTDSLNDILDSSEKEEHTEWINDEGDHEEWGILKPNTPASNLFLFLKELTE